METFTVETFTMEAFTSADATVDNTLHITVPQDAEGQRVDVFLSNYAEEVPTRSAAQRLLSDGRVVLGISSKSIGKNYCVKAGDVLLFTIPAPIPSEATPEDIPVDIVFEDRDLLVVNKPRGMVVHPGAGNFTGTLVNALLHYCGAAGLSGIGGVLRPGIVHRLDKDTSGLMVVAKNDKAHQALSAQLEARTMGRIYNAIVVGAVKEDCFRIDLPIGRHPTDRKKMTVFNLSTPRKKTRFRGDELRKQVARTAATNIEVLARYESKAGQLKGRFTLVAAKLETGRTHQIRVHMAHIGHPVLGDLVYGGSRQPSTLNGQILHATQLSFTHPTLGESMEFNAPWPTYFQAAVNQMLGRLL